MVTPGITVTVDGEGNETRTATAVLKDTPDVTGFIQKDGSYIKTETNAQGQTVTTVITPTTDANGWTAYTQTVTTVTQGGVTIEKGDHTSSSTVTEEKTEALPGAGPTTTGPVETIELPARPVAGTTYTEDGARKDVVVTDILDADGVTVIGYRTETVTTYPDGTTATYTEDLYGVKRTETSTETTTGTQDTTKTETTVTTPVTETKTETKEEVTTTVESGGNASLTVTVSGVTEGEGHGETTMTPIAPDLTMRPTGTYDDLVNEEMDIRYFEENSVSPPTGTGDSLYVTGMHGLQSSIYYYSSKNENVGQYQVVDEKGNAYYGYCIDHAVMAPQEGAIYDIDILEGTHPSYLSKDQADAIRAIALNGYWGTASGVGSMDYFKDVLVDKYQMDASALEGLTPGEAITATQAALWYYGYSDSAHSVRPGTNIVGDRYIGVDGAYYDGDKNVPTDAKNRIQSIYQALIRGRMNAPTYESLDATTLNTQVKAELQPNSSNGDISLTMSTNQTGVRGNFTVTICDANGNPIDTIPVQNLQDFKSASFFLGNVSLANGNYTIKIEGTQDLPMNAYVLAPSVNSQYDFHQSQTLVGLISGKRKVNLSFGFTVNLTRPTSSASADQSAITTTTTETWNEIEKTVTTTASRHWTTTTTKDVELEQYRTWELSYNYPTKDEPTEPEIPETPVEPTTPATPSVPQDVGANSPKTGDTIGIWFLVNALFALGLAVLFVTKRKAF